MRKKITAFILMLVMIVCAGVLPEGVAKAAEEQTYDDYKYIVENGEATIVSYTGNNATISFPGNIESYPVVKIGGRAFYNCDFIEKVVIPESVESIGSEAFISCSKLKTVEGCDGLKEIGRQAFSYCPIETIKLPKSLTKIDKNVFYGCEKLVTAGPSPGNYNIQYDWDVEIPEYAFSGLESLQTVDFPDTLENFAGGCFMDCTGLANVELPDSVTKIESATFSNTGLVEFNIPASVTFIGMDAFAKCKKLERITGGVNLETLGSHAFRDCESLEKITLSEKITSMKYGDVGSGAFSGCKKLKSAGPVGGDFNIEYGWKTEIPIYAFSGADGLETVVFPDTMQTVKMYAFSGSALKNVNTNNITYVGENAFKNCKQLESITGGESLDAIGSNAFENCENLTTVIFNSSPDYNGNRSGNKIFKNCPNLKTVGPLGGGYDISIKFGENFPPFMYFSTGIESVVIPEGVTKISESALSGTAIKEVVLPSTLRHIGYYAFSNCSNLEKIIGGKNVTIIGNGAIEKSDILEIYGYLDTSIEKYAKEKNIPFYPIDGKGRAVYVGALDSLNNKATLNGTAYDIEPSEMSKLSQSVGKYAVANIVPLQSVDAIEPVTSSQIGNFNSIENDSKVLGKIISATIDGKKYNAIEGYSISWVNSDTKKVIYHLKGDDLVGLEQLNEKKGVLQNWNKSTGEITISDTVYGTNFLSDTSYLESLGGNYGSYCSFLVGESSRDANGRKIIFSLEYAENSQNIDKNKVIYYWNKGETSKRESVVFNDLEDYLGNDSTVYNPELAYLLATLAKSAYHDSAKGDQFSLLPEGGGPLPNNALTITESLRNLGFDVTKGNVLEKNYFVNPKDDNYGKDSVAYTISYKEGKNGEKIILIAARGSYGSLFDGDNDWISNFNFKNYGLGYHEGFKIPADEIFTELEKFKINKGISGNDIKYIITGHSRAAAVCNIVERRLIHEKGVLTKNLYGYNFACPDSTRGHSDDWNPDGKYSGIFNINNVKDIVGVIPGAIFSAYTNTINYVKNVYETGSVKPIFWGKFGITRFFSEDWLSPSDNFVWADHVMEFYLDYLEHEKKNITEYKTWEEARIMALLSLNPIIQQGKVIGIFCPVDVEIYDKNNVLVAAVKGGKQYYYTDNIGEIFILTAGDQNLIYLSGLEEYYVKMIGYSEGELTYSVGSVLNSQVEEFSSVALTRGKTALSRISPDESVDETTLVVLDSKGELKSQVQNDGSETPITLNISNKYKEFISRHKGINQNAGTGNNNSNYPNTGGNASTSNPSGTLLTRLPVTTPSKNDKDKDAGENGGVKYFTLYRLYNAKSGEHLYTIDTIESAELVRLGWQQETTPGEALSKGVPIYRLYNPASGGHLYTPDENECKVLTSEFGWVYDNNKKPVFYGKVGDGTSVFRLYNPGIKSLEANHHYVSDKTEIEYLIQNGGWVYDNDKAPVFILK